jgi:serine protease Do
MTPPRTLPRRLSLLPALALRLALALGLMTLVAAGPVRPDPAARVEAALGAVYVVHTAGSEARFLGSAFRWADGAVAVTAAHVVGEAAAVRLTDAAGRTREVAVLARDAVRDVALLALAGAEAGSDGPGLYPGPLPRPAEPVWALGAPLQADFSITAGSVSASARQVEAAVPLRLLQHDAAVNPGSSGGPLVDAEGRLVGMNIRIADGSRHFVGIGYAVAVTDLARIVEGLAAGSLPAVPPLGLHLRPVDRAVAAALGLPPGGALVDRVAPGSAGDRAGLRAGDVILAAGGAALAGPGDLAFAVDRAVAAGVLPLALWRGDEAATATLPLDPPATALRDAPVPLRPAPDLALLGVTLQGTQIAALAEGSAAEAAGLATGDAILSVNGRAAAAGDLAALRLREPALLLLDRPGQGTRHLLLDPAEGAAGLRPLGGANVLDPAVTLF